MSTTTAPAWPRLEDVIDDITRVVARSTNIGCLAHKDADADSLGSALAFALSMRKAGKRTHPMAPAPVPHMLSHLPGFDLLEDTPPHLDALFTFDCATLGRFGDKRAYVEDGETVVNIDHHVSSEGFGTINLVVPDASATGQVVFALLRALDAPIDADVATNLYAALFTDTGGFRHENTTEAALRLGADLVALGANPGWIALKSYKSRSVSQMRLEGLAIARMRTEQDGRLVWSEITREMLTEAGARLEESEGVIDQLQSIDTMQIAVLFKENSEAVTKISVRSRDPYDATDVCTPFGGGGHHRAAGAEIQEPLAGAREKVLDVARRLLTSG
jgi:phosphoesterase RecJ-like protein